MCTSYAIRLNKNMKDGWYDTMVSTNQMIQSKNNEGYRMMKQQKVTRNNFKLLFCGSHKLTKLLTQIVGHKSSLKRPIPNLSLLIL